jgi:hypothetical protein
MQGLMFRERNRLPVARDRRRVGLAPAVVPLEDRRLLSGSSSAVMTQTATFPNIESAPNASTQAILYFSQAMGTLTEVDLVTSGSIRAEFQAENLGTTTTTIEGTVAGNLSINVPTGAVPVTIPSLHWALDAPAFDGTLDFGGTSGKEIAPATSSSSPQTIALTSAADLAAFTGNFRMPLSVSDHTTRDSSATDGKLSAAFNTQTSATITVIYHFIPNLPSLDPGQGADSGQQSSSPPTTSSGGGTLNMTSSPPVSPSNQPATGNPLAGPTGMTNLPGHHKKNVSLGKRSPVHPAIHPGQGRQSRQASNHPGVKRAHEIHLG